MSSVTASTGATIIAALNTVNVAANTLTGLITNLATGSDILSTYVTTARTQQLARTDVEMSQFLIDLEEDSAIEIATRRKKRTDRLANDEDLNKLYIKSKTDLAPVMEKIRARLNPTQD